MIELLQKLQSLRIFVCDDELSADSKHITLRIHFNDGDFRTIDATISHGSRMSKEAN